VAPDLPLGDLLAENALRFPDTAAYMAGNRTRTHRALRDRAAALAAALADRGLRRQDRIAVLGTNSIEFGEVLAAGQLSGLVVATVNYRLAAAEIAAILRDADPAVLFVGAEYVPLIESVRATLPGITAYVRFTPTNHAGYIEYDQFVGAAAGAEPPFTARPADIACLIYTSGTTGRPKGCILGQREMRGLAATMNGELRTGSEDRVLLVMPLFHIGAMAIGLGLHARGGTAVLHRQFDPVAAAATIGAERISVLHLAPTMLKALLDASGDLAGLASVRTVVYSAAPMTTPVLEAALAAMPGAGFLNLYGQTEVITSGLPRELHRTTDEHARRRLTSVGHPFPDTLVRIVDDAGQPCPPGAPGEIIVRSAAMFRGYWNDSVQTAATLRDGWCATGDIGVLDDGGLLYLVDRRKDVIISGGENIYSQQVEEAVSTHPAVAACAVIGVPDERWGEAVCAVVVARSDAALTLPELQDHVRSTLARYKAPRQLRLMDALPVLATGKVDKKQLRARFAVPATR
jgi:acyl-CoA synthetase (AMP-forming)/AMP-acid ligase II